MPTSGPRSTRAACDAPPTDASVPRNRAADVVADSRLVGEVEGFAVVEKHVLLRRAGRALSEDREADQAQLTTEDEIRRCPGTQLSDVGLRDAVLIGRCEIEICRFRAADLLDGEADTRVRVHPKVRP